MGAIIGALIGRHYGQKWMEESSLVKSAMENIQQAFQPGSTATDDFIDMNMNILRQRPGLKKMMPQIEAGIQRMKAYRDAQAQAPQQPPQVAPEARVTSGAPLPSPGLPPPPPAEPPQLAPAFRSPVAGGSPVGGGSEGGPAPLLAPPAESPPPPPPNQIPLPSEVAGPAQQGGGGFAGASVPAIQPMPQQVAVPSQAGGQGFGGAPTTFDQLRRVPGQLGNISPYQQGQRAAAFALPSQEVGMAVRRSLIDEAHAMGLTDPVQISDYVGGRAVQYNPAFTKVVENAMEKANIRDRIAAMQKADSAGPGKTIWDQLSARQKAEVQSGQKNISPELKPQNLPGRVTGESILKGEPNAVDFVGNKLDPKHQYLVRALPDGSHEYVPEVAMTREMLVPDKNSKTGVAKALVDRNGTEVARVMDVMPPSGYMPRVTIHQGIKVVEQADGSLVPYPITSTSVSQPAVPGMGLTPPSAIAPATPPAPLPPGTRLPAARVGTPSPAIGAKFAVEALTPAAQRVLYETEPVHDMINRIKAELEPHKNDNTPAANLLPRIAYALGYGTDQGAFLSALELTRITGGARLIRGSSRAANVLEKAMIHTPNAWKDSSKLMYDKLSTIEKNLTDIEQAARTYGRKSGIVPPTTELAAPSGGAAGAGAPPVGTVVNGFKYTGGNHRDPANWQKVKQ
jgi:hypothetical protein